MHNIYKNPIIIYNPLAAAGKGKKIFLNYHQRLLRENLFSQIDIYETFTKENTIKKIIEIHHEKKNDLIISIGGDGSISTICNGIMQIPKNKRLPLFPLPSGTGNSLLYDFKVLTLDDAIDKYKFEKSKMLDVLEVEEINGNFKCYCLSLLGMGFISDIATYVEQNHKKLGKASYILGSILSLGNFKPYKTIIKYNNGQSIFESDQVFFLTLSNTRYAGGKKMIAPQAKYDDGLMDVLVLHDINRGQFLKGLTKVFKGTHIFEKGAFYFKTNKIEIYSDPPFTLLPDGELEGKSPVRASVLPRQIELII